MSAARVLVVEDERIIAMALRRMLEDRGYEVVGTAASAKTAVEQAKAAAPDIVLMDIHLEGPEDGIEAARQIESEAGTPIVFLTAYTEDETIRRASECRAYSYLVKPVQAVELHATLQVAMARHAKDHQLRASDRRLRLALDASGLVVWERNAESDELETTGDAEGMLGVSGGTISRFRENVMEEDREAVEEVFAGAGGEETEAHVFRYRWNEQTVRWLESFARSYREPRTGRTHRIGTLRDITSQRENEARLRQAAALFENLPDAVAVTTPGLRITTINPAFGRMTGYGAATAVGLSIASLLTIPNLEMTDWQGESACRCADGARISIWLTITPVSSEEGVTALVYTFSDISALRRAQADLDFLAHHDSLTRLPNRLLFLERIEEWTGREEGFTLYYVDLDHFKLINDSRGHSAGDLVLQTVAGRIRELLGEESFAARLGGDEFVLVTPRGNGGLAAKLGAAIAQPIVIGGESMVITGSVGSSRYPEDGRDLETLLQAADTAMYTAKREGPNSSRAYVPALAVPHAERYEIEQGIRRAFALSELQLLYQPTVSLADRRITGAEALVRWQHPERGLLNPDRFVPIAEAAGLIEELGEAVLRMAVRDWAAWQREGVDVPRLSVNVSARQMSRGRFPALLSGILAEHEMAASRVEIEITESSLQTLELGREFIHELKEIGVSVSIDDFGTGYSHLAALRDLPVDRIKLDRAFLPAGRPKASDVELLKAIAGIVRAMNLQMTAEGIETLAQFELVKRIGCDEGQGFWFSHPVPYGSFVELWKRWPAG